MNFKQFCDGTPDADKQIITTKDSFVIQFGSARGTSFNIDPELIVDFLKYFLSNYDECKAEIESTENYVSPITKFQQNPYRSLYKKVQGIEELNTIGSLGRSQTYQLTKVISKLICFLSGTDYTSIEDNTHFDKDTVNNALAHVPSNIRLLATAPEDQTLDTDRETRFRNWLIANNASEKTAISYSRSVIKCASKLLFDNPESEIGSLYDINSVSEVKNYAEALKDDEEWNRRNRDGNSMYSAGLNKYLSFIESSLFRPAAILNTTPIPKPFLLLAGISGTGKTRFVRDQANPDQSNYQLVAVRPDWHEPSDLLGYLSRLGASGPAFVVTDALKFIVSAWKDAISTADASNGQLKPLGDISPFWLCLDEMNLAPVEQYFADYLSILETRKWAGGEYSCDPLLRLDALADQLGETGMANLRNDLELNDDALWDFFLTSGIPLPPNLIVAGTVNMDETTHGFSRKVIDRAYTIDFGEFFPNSFSEFFEPNALPVNLGFSITTQATEADLAAIVADPGGAKSLAFLEAVNSVLKGTAFELAYRALNELFLALVCFTPQSDEDLKAVWDDFLMSKVLPRIDGDTEKLASGTDAAETLIIELIDVLESQFGETWTGERPDLLRKNRDGQPLSVPMRSSKKLDWMSQRLANSGFTSFWP